MLDSTQKENIKKTRKTFTLIVDTKKLCVCQNIPLRGKRDSTKNHPEVRKSGLTNSGNVVELLWHEVKRGDKNLENQPQNAS